jgi:hypothetical protein
MIGGIALLSRLDFAPTWLANLNFYSRSETLLPLGVLISSGYLAGSSSQGRLVVYGDREATNIGIRVEDTGSVILSPTAGNVGVVSFCAQ